MIRRYKENILRVMFLQIMGNILISRMPDSRIDHCNSASVLLVHPLILTTIKHHHQCVPFALRISVEHGNKMRALRFTNISLAHQLLEHVIGIYYEYHDYSTLYCKKPNTHVEYTYSP